MKQTVARRLAAWLVAAMAFAALHPALAAAAAGLLRGTKPALAELCTSHGMQRVRADAGAPSADASGLLQPSAAPAVTDHCPLCRVVGDVLVDGLRDDLRFAVPALGEPAPAGEPPRLHAADRVVGNAPARAPPSGS